MPDAAALSQRCADNTQTLGARVTNKTCNLRRADINRGDEAAAFATRRVFAGQTSGEQIRPRYIALSRLLQRHSLPITSIAAFSAGKWLAAFGGRFWGSTRGQGLAGDGGVFGRKYTLAANQKAAGIY